MIAEEDTFKELINYIGKKNLSEKVVIYSPVPQEELRYWYALSDIVVLPSHNEAFGLVLAEAQLMEEPVVAYNIDGMPEAVGKNAGILVDGEEKNSRIRNLNEALFQMVNTNKGRREDMGKRGRKLSWINLIRMK